MPPTSRFDLVVFDLDGTLAETRSGICASLGHALAALGREPLAIATVVAYVGDGARKLVERALGPGATTAEIERCHELFVAHYLETCVSGSRLYPGVDAMLERLARWPLAVLTNKPSAASTRVLNGLGIAAAFREVLAGDGPGPRKPDPAGLFRLVRRWGSTPARALLVGDTSVDVRTARAAGSLVAGALWGFRPGDFATSRPDWQVADPASLARLVEEAPPAPGAPSGP